MQFAQPIFDGITLANGLEVFLVGLIATSAMVIALDLLHLFGISKPEPLHTLGGLVTGDTQNSFWTGMGMLYTMGTAVSILNFILIRLLPVKSFFPVLVVCSFIGMMFGLLIGFFMLIAVAEHHQDARLRATGLGIAVSFMLAQTIFGVIFGLVMGQLIPQSSSVVDTRVAFDGIPLLVQVIFTTFALVVYLVSRGQLKAIALSSKHWGFFASKETTYKMGEVFPKKIHSMPGGDSDPYGSPNEREHKVA